MNQNHFGDRLIFNLVPWSQNFNAQYFGLWPTITLPITSAVCLVLIISTC